MFRRWSALLLVLAVSCSQAPALSSAPASTLPASTPSTATVPAAIHVAAGVLWETDGLVDLGLPTSNPLRLLRDLTLFDQRLIAGGRDGGEPMILLSDDAGATWRRATVELPAGAEVASISGLAHRSGVLVAVGATGYRCSDPNSLCDDFLGAVWRSTDSGETWIVVDAPSVAPGPESTITDVVAGPDGLVAVGNIYGPAPEASLVWTSPDGLAWSAGVALPPTIGGFTRGYELISGSDMVAISGAEILCGEWFDNGFWVITATFATQARLWTLTSGGVTPVDLAGAGVAQPQVPDCPPDGFLEDPQQYGSDFGDVGLLDGETLVAIPGEGWIRLGSDGGIQVERLALLEDEDLLFVEGADVVIGVRPGERGMMETRSWRGEQGWSLQPTGLPIPSGGLVSIERLMAVGETIVGIGVRNAGVTEGVIWRSLPGSVFEGQELACDPAPGADCRGVDFSGQNLSDRDLTGIDLRHADLSGTDLSRSDLSGALLTSADLWEVNLAGAILRGADLAGVRLSSFSDNKVDLSDADFTGADLRGAHLDLTAVATFDEIRADGAYFTISGTVAGATFRNASLSGAFFTTDIDAASARLQATFDGSNLTSSYFDVDTVGSSFVGVASDAVNFGPEAVCPDGQAPVSEAYGIARCNLGG